MKGLFLPLEGDAGRSREWFHRLANAREDPVTQAEARAWIISWLARANLDLAPTTPGELPATSDDARFANPLDADGDWLAFHAPLALLEGAWLQSLAQAGNGEREETLKLFTVYLTLLGKDEADSPAFAYRGLLNRHEIALADAASWNFAHGPRAGLPAIHFSSLQLALGIHGASLLPETLGLTLAYLDSDSPWRLPALPEPDRRARLESMADNAIQALRAFMADGGEWRRVRQGYALYRQAEADYLGHLAAYSPPSKAARVAEIFQRKLRFALGYHPGIKLGGKGLEDWLAATPFDAAGFLSAFAASAYATGKSGERPFDRLASFAGPMFGVFDGEELSLISAWLNEGAPALQPTDNPIDSLPSNPPPRLLGQEKSPTLPVTVGFDSRGLFHRLINGEAEHETLAAAQRLVGKMLARSRHSQALRKNGRFFDYSPEVFALWIEQIHRQEVARHQPFKPPPRLNQKEYVWGIRQFAPAILVDGCWLQHMGEAARQDSRIHRLLQRIHAEELGEGIMEWNHPHIYRKLLESLDLSLPPTASLEFSNHPGLLDAAFDLPAYLLAISQHPRTYFAEILGLNLAIELSGLGHSYLRLAEELRYWRIDPLIVTLHQSIDNLAGGHAAMAAEAIQLYLEEIERLSGKLVVADHWRRIGCGYHSLNAASRRFKWALLLEFGLRFLPARLLAKAASLRLRVLPP